MSFGSVVIDRREAERGRTGCRTHRRLLHRGDLL